MQNGLPKLLTRKEAAEYLGVKPQTLAAWHVTGKYRLPLVKVGRSVRYRLADLQAPRRPPPRRVPCAFQIRFSISIPYQSLATAAILQAGAALFHDEDERMLAALMALGFALRTRPARDLAMALFALTLTKVFTVDMAKVETVYRILSFLCLGTLLVAASWLYHRFFREKAAAG